MTAPTRGPGPSRTMRLLSRCAGARAKRHEGRPADLVAARRAIDRMSDLARAPDGVDLTHEHVAQVPVVRLSSGGAERGTVLHLHGGAYVLGSARQVLASAGVCRDDGPDMVSVEYRLAPEHPWPAAVDDALAVYRDLVQEVGPDRLVVTGESAGGGLALLLLQRARDEGLPMPRALVAMYPAADLTLSGDSTHANQGKDILVRSELVQQAAWFTGGRATDDPAVSPLFGSFTHFPPTWIAVGTHDLLLDDAHRVADAMAAAGVDVHLQQWPGVTHAFTTLPVPEGRRFRRQLRDFVHATLPRADGPGSKPNTLNGDPT